MCTYADESYVNMQVCVMRTFVYADMCADGTASGASQRRRPRFLRPGARAHTRMRMAYVRNIRMYAHTDRRTAYAQERAFISMHLHVSQNACANRSRCAALEPLCLHARASVRPRQVGETAQTDGRAE